ncbi:MAG: TspO/MBR family protein [Christensenella sp.]
MFVMTYKMEEDKHEKHMRIVRVLGAVGITTAGAVIASFLTDTTSAWYQNLVLSPIQPPPWVFGAVWTVLYVLLAISFAHAVSKRDVCRPAVIGFIINIILNAMWSPIFFLLYAPVPALIIMLALIANLIVLMRNVFSVSRPSFYLLIPYISWLCIATVLNVSVIALN